MATPSRYLTGSSRYLATPGPARQAGLAVIIFAVALVGTALPLPGAIISLFNPLPAALLAVFLINGLGAWPAAFAGLLAAALVYLPFQPIAIAAFSIGPAVAGLAAASAMFGFWRSDLARHGVYDLVVLYASGALFAMIFATALVPYWLFGLDFGTELLFERWVAVVLYGTANLAVFLPPAWLLLQRLPKLPSIMVARTAVDRAAPIAWVVIVAGVAAVHLNLLQEGQAEMAATIRLMLVLSLVVAAFRFGLRFVITAGLGVASYLMLSEAYWLRLNPEDFTLVRVLDTTLMVLGVTVMSQFVVIFRLQQRVALQDLRHQASHDALTGYLNREAMQARIVDLLAGEQDRPLALVYIDIDRFTPINDECGVQGGDTILREIAREISLTLPADALFGRVDGDDFIVTLVDCSDRDAVALAEQIRERVGRASFRWQDRVYSVTASIGVVPFSRRIDDVSQLILTAGTARDLARMRGGDRVERLAVDADVVAARRRASSRVHEILQAIREARFELHCQQLKPLAGGPPDVFHYEVLARMRSDTGELVPPAEVFPVAAQHELMREIDRLVVTQALEWLGRHREGLKRTATCCINLCGPTLDPENVGWIRGLMDALRIPPEKLCFEVTETAAVERLQTAVQFMEALKIAGCRFALDDFGTGVSSLEYFRELPVDKVKIDGTFIRGLQVGSPNYAIVEAVVSIATAFNLESVAEFVDSPETEQILRELGVTYGQGYGIHKPEAMADLLLPSGR